MMCIYFDVPMCSSGCFDKAKVISVKDYCDMDTMPMMWEDIAYVGY